MSLFLAPRARRWRMHVGGLGLLIALTGCAASGPAGPTAPETAAVVGRWTYQTRGTSLLGDGRLRIEVRDERLRATLHDDRRGRLVARVRVDEERIEFDVEHIEVAGRVEDGRITGIVRWSMWDVSNQRSPRHGTPSAGGTLVARRLGAPAVRSSPTEYGCVPLLRESSYACPPLP